MKRLLIASACSLTFLTTEAQQLRTPQPSTTQTIRQDFGLGTIEISYSRPNMKGRKVFGDLVPFGAIWRTGANAATTLTFSDEVMIGGTKVPAGKYGLLSIPGAAEWTMIISKQTNVTSPTQYKQDQDVVRVAVKPMSMPASMETFTLQIANVSDTKCELHLMWEKTAVALPIGTEVDSKVMQQIENTLLKDSRPYFNAALYYLDNGKDLNQAVAWFDKAIEQNPRAYWVHYQKARALAKQGKKQEALQVSNRSLELAREMKNDDYVALNEKLQAELKK
ncbi:MAG TPA: DUF2911 domain-containing protein [Lacibacter sp.]|nr:DUF2911 domain-containing protein [Lacibacter sp.]HMO90020.1 DUF2911 domain-containing protein [Lacibacter sp.]HMP88206.1 DUF2911 domain-containing protein [Lacibacter sp.]